MAEMKSSVLRWALGACAMLPLIAQAAAQMGVTAPKAPQQTSVLLQADEIVYDDDKQLVSAVGHVEVADQGRTLLAERVDYDQVNDKVTASGHVSITDTQGNVAFADHVVLSDHMRDGVLSGFGALIGRSGRLAARGARRIGGTTVIARSAVYSPCKICNQPGQTTPLWRVKAERIVYDQVQHKVKFHSATIDVAGVPVAWLPFFSVADPTVRYATGLLTPEVGNSTKTGYFTRLPVYISISPTEDLTIEPMFSTKGGEVLQAEFRARWGERSGMWLQGSGAYTSNGTLSGTPGVQTYGHLFGAGRFALSDNWRTGFDVQTTTNSGYMRFYDISFLDRLVNDL
ncbi:MAG TPA: hypothetical protein VFQ52_06730, partial [Rhizomicrobium sp.]|nr:hypothetical protein [Rhizomicrobium sp.]